MARSKKEIDKELMYKKLMPTAQTSTETDDDAASAPAAPLQPLPAQGTTMQNVKEAAPLGKAESGLPGAAAPVPTPPVQPAASPMQAQPAPAAPLDASPISTAAAAIISGEAPVPPEEIINVMELLVDARIDAAMEKFRCCTCDKCRKDVTAVTLNKLAPNYILSSDNAKRIEIETKYAGQVATALVQAILTVKARPAHE